MPLRALQSELVWPRCWRHIVAVRPRILSRKVLLAERCISKLDEGAFVVRSFCSEGFPSANNSLWESSMTYARPPRSSRHT